MEIAIPLIPAGVATLLSFFSPYAVSLINHPAWPAGSKRLVAALVSVLISGVVLAGYFTITGDAMPQWPVLVLLVLVVQQAAYTTLYKSATDLEGRHGNL